METLTDRITRYLLSRIHRLAVLDLYERAAGVGLLEQASIIEGDEQSGTVWRVPEHSLRLLRSEPVKLHAELGRRLRRATYKTPAFDVYGQDFAEPAVRNVRSSGTRRNKQDTSATATREASDPECRNQFLTQLRKHIAPPSVAHVAIALLLARAVGSSIPDLSLLSAVLRNPGAFVLIKAPVGRFERRFALMLEDGLILPYRAKLEEVYRSSSIWEGSGDRRRKRPCKTIKTLSGTDVQKAVERSLSKSLVDAFSNARPRWCLPMRPRPPSRPLPL